MPHDPGIVRAPARPQAAPGPLALLVALLRLLPHLPGMTRSTWAYLTRPGRITRSFHDCDGAPASVPPPSVEGAGVLRRSDGRGPLYHRVYEVVVDEPLIGPEELVTRLLVDPNRASPTDVAVFDAQSTDRGVGAEFVVRMPGPWDAPVRVVERTPTSFRFATLRGHMEAGDITFSAAWGKGGRLVFRIESWARSADRLIDLLYDRFPVTREMQLHMRVTVCEEVVRMTGGTAGDGVSVTTCRWKRG
jgi:hypothetical protein